MLTVVVPNFNHGRFLPASLGALLAQTRPADELIVIDDASTDRSVAVVEEVLAQARHPNARLVRNPRNIGVVESMNRGLQMAQGALVYFAAADDLAYPGLLARAADLLEANPDAALFSARVDMIDADGGALGVLKTPLARSSPGPVPAAEAARLLMRDGSWMVGTATVYRRAPLLREGGFCAELDAFCDGYASQLLALRHGACFSPEVLAAWRLMEGGMATSQTTSGERTAQVVAAAQRRMAEAGVFPAGYAERWRGRFLFGARRYALSLQRRRAMARGFVPGLAGAAREALLTAWLFARLRPRDAWPVMRRRLQAAS